MKKRNYGLDLLRIVLCIFVISIHSLAYFGDTSPAVQLFVPTILGTANGLFYVLSGYFNLEKEFRNSSDIRKFYKNKFIYILLPFLGFNLFWVAWDYLHAYGSFNLTEFLYVFYDAVMDSSAKGHMWFMYPLFGMLLSTPFLSKMLHAMDEKELKIMWRIGIGFSVVSYLLCENFGVNFKVSNWLLMNWMLYYVAGYYFRHVASKESAVKWVVLGLIGYFFTIFGMNNKLTIFKQFVGANDLQPMYTLFCMGFLYIWSKVVVLNGDIVGKITSFLGRNAYLIYLFHIRGIEYAARKLHVVETGFTSGLIVVCGAFVFSLIAAFAVNLVMKPVLKTIDKVWTVK